MFDDVAVLIRLLALTLVSFAIAASPAAGASRSLEFTGDGPDPVTLKVGRDGERFCFDLGDRTADAASSCFPVTLLDLQDPWFQELRTDTEVAGAVYAAAATVRYRLRDGQTLDLPTRPLPGLGGRLESAMRFFAGRLPADAAVRSVLLLDAAGAPLGETPAGDEAWSGLDGAWTLRSVRALVADPRQGWRVSATVRASVDPLPGQPLHRRRSVCVRAVMGTARGQSECVDAAGLLGLPSYAERCGARHRVVSGVVPVSGGAVQLLLGDGRRVPARTATLGALGAPALQVYAARLPVQAALREVRLARSVPGLGRVVSLRRGPTSLTCRKNGVSVYLTLPGSTASPVDGVTATFPSGAPVGLSETDQDVCVRIGGPPRGRDCGRAPVRLDQMHVAEAPGQVAGVVDARVKVVEVRRRDGRLVPVATVPPPAGAGPIVSRLRMFSYAGTGARQAIGVVARLPVGSAFPWPLTAAYEVRRSGIVARQAGLPIRLQTIRVRGLLGFFEGGCLVVGATGSCTLILNASLVAVEARCETRRVVLAGRLTPSTHRVVVVLADGTRIPARLLRRGPASGVWFAILPGRRSLREVLFENRRGRVAGRAAAAVPPGRSQCGYAEWVDIRSTTPWTPPPAPASDDPIIRGYSAKTAAAVSPPLVPMNESVMITR